MITNSQEYKNYLWALNSPNKPVYHIVLPKEEPIYKIDLNTRTIHGPDFLSVAKDHASEIIYFVADRYYEHYDLAQTTCLIFFKNKTTGRSSSYAVPFYDLSNQYSYLLEKEGEDTNKQTILFPWCIDSIVTEEPGEVEYSMQFYDLNDNYEIIYKLNTVSTVGHVKQGLHVNTNSILDLEVDKYTELRHDVNQLMQWQDLYWEIIE